MAPYSEMTPNRAHGASFSSAAAASTAPAIQSRIDTYLRLYRPPRRFHHLEYILDPMLRPALQPCTRGGRSIGRPVTLGSPRHRFLTTHLPRLFPPPSPDEQTSLADLNAWLRDQRAASRRSSRRPPPSITRHFRAREWRLLGFGTRREGEAFIRQVHRHDRGIDLSTPAALRACLEQHHASDSDHSNAAVHAEEPVLLDQAYRGYSRSYRLPYTGHATDYFAYGDVLQQAAVPVVQEAQGVDHRPVKASIACSGIFLRPVELDDDGTPAAYRDLLRAMQIGAPDWRIRQLIDALSDDQRRQFVRVGRFETTMGLVVGTEGAGTVLDSQRQEINSQIDRMTDQGSGWIFLWMLQGYVNILEHDFLEGGSYMPLPKTIQSRNACINPKNLDDDLCFLYSCVIAMHYTEIGCNPERVSKLRPFLARYACDAKDMPMVAEARRVIKYEQVFQARINIIHLTATEALVPLVCSQARYDKEINLLLLTDEDNGRSHYVWVRRPSALISSQTRDPSHAHHVCWRCLWMTRSAEAYAQHAADCGPGRACARAVMPSPVGKRKSGETKEAYTERVETAGRPTMRFRQWEKTLRLPVVIYADGEATTSTRGQGPISERTAVVATQCINSIRMVVVETLWTARPGVLVSCASRPSQRRRIPDR